MKKILILVLLLIMSLPFIAQAGQAQYALSLGTTPKYPPGFTHFDYVNPDAPKGGLMREAAIGSFDTFNPFGIKGNSASGIGLIYDTLTSKSLDEPFTEYGLIAESMELDKNGSWIIFNLRPQARFSDGQPVTAQDVVFSFDLLTSKGNPFYKQYYRDVTKVQALNRHQVKFELAPKHSPELPLILGELYVLPQHFWQDKDFGSFGLQIPIGSGPYKIKKFKAGAWVEYERNPDYWGKNIAVNKGRYNFDIIRIDYYRDMTVALQALKADEVDFRLENISKNWATAYDIPAVREKRLIKSEIPNSLPQGMQCFVFNTRKKIFQNPKVRQALAYAFDFEWSNKHLFYGQYSRSKSFFSNSDMASTGLPSPAELKLLKPLQDQIPPQVFTKTYAPPSTDGSGNIRHNLRQALRLLRQACWSVQNGILQNKEHQPFEFEILLVSPSFERVVLPFIANLKKLGIKTSVRVVDSSQYINRMRNFDYDMIVGGFGQSLSPGNEQRSYWHSASADMPGSRNYIGIKDPAVDSLVEEVIKAQNREALVTSCRALDRVLLWGHYVIPHWHIKSFRVVYWNKFDRPKINPPYGLDLYAWWIKPDNKE